MLQAPVVEAAVASQTRILDALAADASIQPNAPNYHYNIAEAGFNFVDDECTSYFNTLFFLDRTRERNKNLLLNAAQTTNAILSVTGATSLTLAVVAQAFGLGVNITDIVSNTYLYQLPPAVTLGFVREMRLAYRNGAAARRADINSRTKAYTQIQEYLSLCLPPTIEGKLVEVIKAARVFPDPVTGTNPTFGLNIGSVPIASRQALEQAISQTVLPNSTTPMPTSLSDPQRGQRPSDISSYQRSLCVEPDGKIGDKTLEAVHDFLRGALPGQEANVKDIGPREQRLLRGAGDCKARGFRSAFEVGAYGVNVPNMPNTKTRILELQRAVRDKVDPNLPLSGELDAATRNAVRALRKKLNLNDSDAVDEQLHRQLFQNL